MKRCLPVVLAFALTAWSSGASAAEASSVTQYGVTWTFDRAYETGQFATGDYWVVGPAKIVSVSPAPTAGRNGSCVNPKGGGQGYDNRGGEFTAADRVTLPYDLLPDSSLVSSVSKPEGADVKNAGSMISQAVLTAVGAPRAAGALRPAFAGTYRRHFDVSQIRWDVLPKLPSPSSVPSGTQLIASADRPRADHLNSWTIQNSCAEQNWNNGPGQHACYGREVSAFVSDAALYVMLDTANREELARSMIQLGIDNYGILKAGGKWAPNGGHHSGRKWPIVFAARMLNDCDMLAVGKDYGDSYFGEDGQTYVGTGGEALFGWDCGGGQGAYFQSGCAGSGAKDCRDPAGAVDGCPDYRNCCTSSVWVGQMLSALMLGARSVWNHDAYFDYVDRWMTGGVSDGDGTNAFGEAMWALYRDDLPELAVPPACGTDQPRDAGATGGTSGSGGASGSEPDSGVTTGGRTSSAGGAATATGGRSAGDGGASGAGAPGKSDAGGDPPKAASDDSGCGCRVPRGEAPSRVPWMVGLLMAVRILRMKRTVRI